MIREFIKFRKLWKKFKKSKAGKNCQSKQDCYIFYVYLMKNYKKELTKGGKQF